VIYSVIFFNLINYLKSIDEYLCAKQTLRCISKLNQINNNKLWQKNLFFEKSFKRIKFTIRHSLYQNYSISQYKTEYLQKNKDNYQGIKKLIRNNFLTEVNAVFLNNIKPAIEKPNFEFLLIDIKIFTSFKSDSVNFEIGISSKEDNSSSASSWTRPLIRQSPISLTEFARQVNSRVTASFRITSRLP
jgi:hypothetical protein